MHYPITKNMLVLLVIAFSTAIITAFSIRMTHKQAPEEATEVVSDTVAAPSEDAISNEISLTNPVAENIAVPPEPTPISDAYPYQDRPALSLSGTRNPQILKLRDYQSITDGFVADRLMVFTNMPQTATGIRATAQYINRTAKEFKKYSLKPIFVFEPSDENGSLLNLKKISQGKHQKNLEGLFAEMKKSGITGKDLGILVPYPEINTPSWDRKGFSPEDFPLLVNGFFDIAKNYFPDIEGGLLLNGTSYDTEEKSWNNGKSISLKPYVIGIKKSSIRHFGLQGFPWVSENGKEKAFDAETFLPIALAAEAARTIGSDTIWFNTGTFREKYSIGRTSISPTERSAMLSAILKQAEKVRENGFGIWINLFAQNKMRTTEKTDWSYMEAGKSSGHEKALTDFITSANARSIELSFFDR